MKEKTARTWTPRLGPELPDVILPDIRDHRNGGRRGLRGVKNPAPGGWGKLRTQVEWGTFNGYL